MATAIYDSDYVRADGMMIGPMASLRNVIAHCIAMERERCALVAEAAANDFNGKEKAGMARAIARRIRALPSQNQTEAKS